jgi:methionyl-tRNA formyltransferase
MKIVYFTKGDRGVACLKRIIAEGANISMVVLQPSDSLTADFTAIAEECGAEVYAPEDPNAEDALARLRSEEADVFVLGGYGLILKPDCIGLPKSHCINLHGGRLPQYRGSSPLNWSLVNDEPLVGISIIEVATGIDTGDVLAEAKMNVEPDTTIADLHEWANQQFPEMLVTVLKQMAEGTLKPRVQDDTNACYYPRRFPSDGMILWDQLTAQEIHNRIRGLTKPYPCAHTYFGNRQVKLIQSELPKIPFKGEAGRIYRKTDGRLLIGASDQAIWITEAEFGDDGSSFYDTAIRYDTVATIREVATEHYKSLT